MGVHLAQVRQPLEDLHYGDRVEIVREEGIASQVRTASGIVGWLQDTRQLMDPALWQQSASLPDPRAHDAVQQARGQTKTVSNVRVEPGRNGRRIFQFTRGTRVLILSWTIAEASISDRRTCLTEKSANNEAQQSKQEDWLFVMRADSPNSKSPSETEAKATVRPEALLVADRYLKSLRLPHRQCRWQAGFWPIHRSRLAGAAAGLCHCRRPACDGMV